MNPKRYMPLHESANQRLQGAIPCDGACSFMEIPAAIFTPGARSWDQVMGLEEYSLVMQLFLFWLEVLRTVDAYVVLETLVTNDFEDLHHSEMGRLVNVVGYRLWAVLNPEQQMTVLKQVSITLSDNCADQDDRKRKFEESVEIPPYKELVRSKMHLLKLVRLYNSSGRGPAITDFSSAPSTSWDDEEPHTFLDHFNMNLQFSRDWYLERAAHSDLYTPQSNPDNYVRLNNTGSPVFFPVDSLRKTGIIRAFKLGGGGFLESKSTDIFNYFLPQYSPTTAELQAKYERCLAAIGSFVSLRDKTREELIQSATSTDPFGDPHDFSAVTAVHAGEMSRDLDSLRLGALSTIYTTAQELHDRNAVRLRFLKSTCNVKGTYKFYGDITNNIHLVFSGDPVKGLPLVLNDLYKENRAITELMRSDETWVRKANAIFYHGNETTRGYTGLSHMINKLTILSRENLMLMPQQQSVFLLMYLWHMMATSHLTVTGTIIILCGRPETGKSHAMNMLAECVAHCLILREGSSSELAGTDGNHDNDLRIKITDENRSTRADSKDSSSGTKDLNEQSAYGEGLIYHSRLLRDPSTGIYSTAKTVTASRYMDFSGTNMPQNIPSAKASRACIIPVTSLNSASSQLRSGAVASSMASDIMVAEDGHACKLALKMLSSLQVRTTALEAFGGLPPLDSTCIRVFIALLEKMLGIDAMQTRRKNDLARLARAVKVWNDTSIWHCRGLGKRYDYDVTIEYMFLASRQYIRMEEVIVAYVMLEQTRSMSAYMREIMMTLKLNVLIVDGEMAQTDNYYFSSYSRDQDLVARLVGAHPQLGDGVVLKCFTTMRVGCTNKLPNIDRVKNHEGVEQIAFNKEWLGTVNTPVEDAILLSLQRLIDDKSSYVTRDFDTENMYVFSARVRSSLVNPVSADALHFPELIGESKHGIRHGFSMLESRRLADNTLCFNKSMQSFDGLKLVDAGFPGAVPSDVYAGRYKVSKAIPAPLVVHPSVFELRSPASVSIDLIKAGLIVAGGYDNGKRIFAGIDPAQPGDDLVDNFVLIEDGEEVSVTVNNMYYRHDSMDGVVYGGVEGLELATYPDIFPDGEREVTFTEESNIERIVREKAYAQVPLSEEMRAAFEEASCI